jgi:hypothetical protein
MGSDSLPGIRHCHFSCLSFYQATTKNALSPTPQLALTLSFESSCRACQVHDVGRLLIFFELLRLHQDYLTELFKVIAKCSAQCAMQKELPSVAVQCPGCPQEREAQIYLPFRPFTLRSCFKASVAPCSPGPTEVTSPTGSPCVLRVTASCWAVATQMSWWEDTMAK